MKRRSKYLTRRTFLSAATGSAVAAGLPGFANTHETNSSSYTLHFAQPASKWPDALPVGNGRLGAMVFGAPGLDRLQLNEESIWDGEPNRDRNNPRAAAAIQRIRELLFAGNIAEAQALAV